MAPRRPRAPRRRPAAKPRRATAPRKKYPKRKTAQRSAAPKRQLIQANLGGISMTRFAAARRANNVVKTIKSAGAPNHLNLTYSWNLRSDGGAQGIASAWVAARNDLMRIWASIQGQGVMDKTATTNSYPTTGNATWRYALESVSSLLYFANTGPTPVNIELYDIATSKNGPAVFQDMSGQIITAGGKMIDFDPTNAWQVGVENERSQATGFANAPEYSSSIVAAQNLGATPYNSQLFKRYFKVVRKTNLSLPIGGQHKHIVDLKPNCLVDYSTLAESSTLAGVSFFTMMVVSGVPIVASAEGLPNPVSVSATSVSVVQTLKYKWTWAQDAQQNVYRVSYIDPSKTNYQSIQPAMTKLYNAGTSGAYIIPGNDLDVNVVLPNSLAPN